MSRAYNRKDKFYNAAKEQGFRSRAYYKLEEIDKKYRLFRPGVRVLDLGAWPGGWLQYSGEVLGADGLVVGIDLKPIEEIGAENIKVLTGDVRDSEVIQNAARLAGGVFDVVVSDLAPHLSGIRDADNAAMLEIAETVLRIARTYLVRNGSLVIKLFKSQEIEHFIKALKNDFGEFKREELDSTRKSSSEFYIVARRFNRVKGGGRETADLKGLS